MSILPYYNNIEKSFLRPFDFERPSEFFKYSPLVRDDFFKNIFQDDFFESMWRRFNNMSLQEFGTRITSDNDRFQINIDVQNFAPEEITVKVVDNTVYVEGKHEEKRDQHGYVSRQFARQYTLPEGCLPSAVESTLTSDGVLKVSCPRRLALPYRNEKIIPVKYSGPYRR